MTSSPLKQVTVVGAALVVAAIALFLLYELIHVIALAMTALLLAVGLVGLVSLVSRVTRLKYSTSYALLLFATIGFIALSMWLFGDWVGGTGVSLSEQAEALKGTVVNTIDETPVLSFVSFDQLFDRASEIAGSEGIFSQIATGLGSIATGVTQLALVLLVAVYIAANPFTYKNGLLDLIPTRYQSQVKTIQNVSYRVVLKWFAARGLSMLVVGIFTYVGLWLLGIPYAPLLALLAFALSFIPNLGPILSYLPAALVALSLGPTSLLYVSIVYLVVQLIESNLITPLIQQKLVTTPPALLLLAQLAGGVLFGLLGILLAAPILAITVALVKLHNKNKITA